MLIRALLVSFIVAPALVASGCAKSEEIQVLLETQAGDIQIELYPEAAPVTVANFLKYVEGGHYDGATFYRVVRQDNQAQNNIKIEVIQGGRGMEDMSSPFAPIGHETTADTGLLHRDGVISMARLEPGTATSEFFICVGDQPELDYGGQRNPDGEGFAAFGKVVRGMSVVRAIQNSETDKPEPAALEYTSGQMLVEPVTINRAVRLNP